MSNPFLYDNGQGEIRDEAGNLTYELERRKASMFASVQRVIASSVISA